MTNFSAKSSFHCTFKPTTEFACVGVSFVSCYPHSKKMSRPFIANVSYTEEVCRGPRLINLEWRGIGLNLCLGLPFSILRLSIAIQKFEQTRKKLLICVFEYQKILISGLAKVGNSSMQYFGSKFEIF